MLDSKMREKKEGKLWNEEKKKGGELQMCDLVWMDQINARIS